MKSKQYEKEISMPELRRRRAAILAGKAKTTPALVVHAHARRIVSSARKKR